VGSLGHELVVGSLGHEPVVGSLGHELEVGCLGHELVVGCLLIPVSSRRSICIPSVVCGLRLGVFLNSNFLKIETKNYLLLTYLTINFKKKSDTGTQKIENEWGNI